MSNGGKEDPMIGGGRADQEDMALVSAKSQVVTRLKCAAEAYGMSETEAATRAIRYSLRHHEDACTD